MSYCRFRNTLIDLDDCYNQMDGMESLEQVGEDLSHDEKKAMLQLVGLCKAIADQFEDDPDIDENHAF